MDEETRKLIERFIEQMNALTEAVENLEQAAINVGRGHLLANARMARIEKRLQAVERRTLPN